MSDEEYESDDSKLVKDLRKQITTLSKELDEAKAESGPLRVKLRQREIADVLTERGLKSSISKFIPSDLETDGLDAWLLENAEVFNLDLSAKDEVVDAEAGAQQRQTAVQTRNAGGVEEEFARRIANAKDQNELNSIIAEAAAAGL